MLIVENFQQLAVRLDLDCQVGKSPDGLDEIYLFSHDMHYRYAFARWWDSSDALILWVMLNPATGDTEKRHRPTLKRCIDRSRALGASGVIIANLFAARHTKPDALRVDSTPVGPHNDAVLSALSALAMRTFVAWGAEGGLHGRAEQVGPLLRDPRCLGVAANGQPRHPLYVRRDVADRPWDGALRAPE